MRGVHGGVKFYRGSATAARAYVEADRSRADDYYLAEGTGLATRYVAERSAEHGDAAVAVVGSMDGPAYERWVAGFDVETGVAKGRLRTDERGLRFVEVVVNGPKSWSLAASVHPEIAAAYDAAQERAAVEIIGWLASHATTRVGPRGRQVQVPVEQLEAAVVRHYTSRAGDPHRHLHLQINARVFAQGRWRGLHSVGVVDSIEAINGIGHAAVACDPGFRNALARTRLHARPEEPVRSPSSHRSWARSVLGRRRSAATSTATRPTGGPSIRVRSPAGGCAGGGTGGRGRRPDRTRSCPPTAPSWPPAGVRSCTNWGSPPPSRASDRARRWGRRSAASTGTRWSTWCSLGWVRGGRRGTPRTSAARSKRSSPAVDIIAPGAVRRELVEDLTGRTIDACVPLLDRPDVPEHVRGLTSRRVLRVEEELVHMLTARAEWPAHPARVGPVVAGRDLDEAQRPVVAALAGSGLLLVIEGAAGAGKTTTLAAARELLESHGQRLVVVTPTLKAARVAQQQVGTDAFSAAWLAHQHGYRWDSNGRWNREQSAPEPAARLLPGDVLLVDEAGMLDQDTARALLTIADEAGARVAFVGDRHQLPAVGRGGVLDHAARWASPEARLEWKRCTGSADPAYADLTLLMRTGERPGEVFDALVDRGQIVVHAERGRTPRRPHHCRRPGRRRHPRTSRRAERRDPRPPAHHRQTAAERAHLCAHHSGW